MMTQINKGVRYTNHMNGMLTAMKMYYYFNYYYYY